jgi:hypothetical protein
MEMDDELIAQYRRWLSAEQDERNDDADAACRAVFEEALTQPLPSLDFTARTVAAVAAQTAADAERRRRARGFAGVAAGVAVIAGGWFGGGLLVSAVTSVMLGAFDLLIGAVVRTAAGVDAGAGLWSVLSSMGRAASAFVSDPTVTFVLLVMQGLAIAALAALQRLLGSDGESLK